MPVVWIVSALLAALLGTVLVRTLRMPRSSQPVNDGPAPVPGDGAAVAGRLSGAIRYRTIAHTEPEKIDGAQFLGLHAYLRASYPLAAKTLTWEVVSGYSLLLTWKGCGEGLPVAMLAHLDVVPVAEGTGGDWTHPAFDGHFDGETVWGRGAADMKGHLISLLDAVEGLLAEGFRPQSDVYLCFGHNEEIVSAPEGGAGSIVRLLQERGIRLRMVVDEGGAVMEGGQALGIPGLIAVVGTAEKGYMDIGLTCAQEGGHSSQPPQSTALGILSRAVVRLENSPAKPRLIGTVRSMFLSAGRRMGFMRRMIFANLWLFEPLLMKTLAAKPLTNALVRTTFAATMAAGSPAANVLPQRAEVVANMRLLPGEDMDGALGRVAGIVGDDRVQVSLIKGRNPSAESPTDTAEYRLVKDALEALYPGVLVTPYLMIGGTDASLYEPVCGNIYRVSPFLMGSDEMKATHGTNERISAVNLLRGVAFFRKIMMNC